MKSLAFSNLLGRRVVFPAVILAVTLSMLPLVTSNVYAASDHSRHAPQKVSFRQHFKFALVGNQPPTDSQCRANFGVPCYSPQEIRDAYSVTPLLNAGYTGKGQSIVIIDSFGSPTILQDLQTFDADYGLPDPPSLKVLAPLGTIQFDPNNSDMVGWAAETTLDVE